MGEYIKKDALLDKARETADYFKIKGFLCGIPAADVEPVRHGRWKLEPTNPYDDPGYKNRMIKRCSCCGWQNACRYNYCPNCGAHMDEKV